MIFRKFCFQGEGDVKSEDENDDDFAYDSDSADSADEYLQC